ncbi:MAG: hypothetical protein WDO19_12750 [Bacteroidota bacterium]
MLKRIYLLSSFLIVGFITKAQDNIGYTTTDVGAEAQWNSSGGYTGVMHVAFNGAVHSGFQVRAGYNFVDRKNWGDKHAVENGGGPGGGIGYRYYFPFRPHQFFLGIRSDIWRLKIDWSDALVKGTAKTWTLHPAAEAGYMFLINDMAFIYAGCISRLYFQSFNRWSGYWGRIYFFSRVERGY